MPTDSASAVPSGQVLELPTPTGKLTLLTNAPVVTEHPGQHIYPEWSAGDRHLPVHMGYGADAQATALAYARATFPGATFKVISDQGWSSVILEDSQGHIYKVFRSARNYHEVEDEIAAIAVLHGIGLGPRPFILVDATADKRAVVRGEEREMTFTDEPFQRVATAGDYPIIIMERVPHTSLDALSDKDKFAEFDRVLSILVKHGIVPVDAEPVVDVATKRVVLLDAGSVSRMPQRTKLDAHESGRWEKGHPELTDEQVRQVEITFWLLLAFKGWHRRELVLNTLLRDGSEGIHQLIGS